MANVVDRTTLETLRSVHTPNYSSLAYVINPPNFDLIEATPRKYRKISGDTLSVMNQAEMDAADAAEAQALIDALNAAAKSVYDTAQDEYSKPLKAVALVILNELNLHAEKINAILAAIDAATSLTNLQTRIAAIADYPTRTAEQFKTAVDTKVDEL